MTENNGFFLARKENGSIARNHKGIFYTGGTSLRWVCLAAN
ncbi:hypothetical protein KKC1_08190 [Calderihabitans maritimus]|uniref:Uncharacterized protein n=1 Tax=Calderihabitans maritimus TaxID=1246530 RepID=A0A1Z5HQE6_9FIRM|nr:hypothetical protein KKC1_08190 [Calderihabitans maritimus]